ncbi:MAG: O-antigen ligase family protein [Vicinamibacterales bacterium]
MSRHSLKAGDILARLAAVAMAAFVCAFPLRGFFAHDGLPLALKLSWLVLVAAALAYPLQSLLVFIASFPLLSIVPDRMGWPPVSLAEIWLFALLVAAWLRVAAGRLSWRAGLPGAWAIFMAIVAASLAVVLYPFHLVQGGAGELASGILEFMGGEFIEAASQRHLYAPVVAAAVMVEGLASWWLVAIHARSSGRASVRHVLLASATGAAVVAGIGIVQRYTGAGLLPFWVRMDPSIVRINSTFPDVNSLGSYLAMMLWIAVAVARFHRRAAWRAAWLAVALASAVAAVFTASRIAWAAILAGAFMYAFGLWRFGLLAAGSWLSRHMGRILAAGVSLGVVVVVAASTYATVRNVRYWDQQSYLDGVLYTLNLRLPADQRLKGRGVLWEAALRMMRRQPVAGIGVGRYYKEVYAYAVPQEALPRPQENAHNYFLQVGAELGLAGLLALLALAGGATRGAIRVARSSSSEAETRHTALAVAVGLIAYCLTWLTGHPMLLRSGQFAFWSIAAAAAVMEASHPSPTLVSRERYARVRELAIAATCLVVAASVPVRALREEGRLDLSDHTFGLYGTEYDPRGIAQRWSGPSASIYFPATASAFRIPLRSLAPFPQSVRIVLDGQPADEVKLSDHAWHVVRYINRPGRTRARYRQMDLFVEPPWQPEGDSRLLGVLVGDYKAE